MSNVNHQHAHDHAVVSLHGHLDWDAAFALVDTIGTMVESYFYMALETVVSLRRAQTRALDFCLACLAPLAPDQVRLRASVLSFAGRAVAGPRLGPDSFHRPRVTRSRPPRRR